MCICLKKQKQNETKQKRVRPFELVILVEYHTFYRSAANRSTSAQELSLLDEPRLSYAKTIIISSPASLVLDTTILYFVDLLTLAK